MSVKNPKTITARRLSVLELVFIGKTNEEIGQILGLSELTVKNHIYAILRILGAYNRQNAVYNALKQGLLKVPA